MDKDKLKKLVNNKKVLIYGEGKYKDDFVYVFNEILTFTEVDNLKLIGNENIVVICSFDKSWNDKLEIMGYIRGEDFVYGEDLFFLLDEHAMKGVGVLPSEMMTKTLHAPMVEQIKCTMPFVNLNVGGRYTVHPCCVGFSQAVGNLKYNKFDEIWNSINLKIYRLSMINRTYVFCNKFSCVHLKINPSTTNERINNIIIAKDYPTRLELGIDTTCNLYCRSCRNQVVVAGDEKKKELDTIRDSIIESGYLEKVDTLMLGGSEEPLFSQFDKDLIFNNPGKRKKLDLRTNGTLLTKDRLMEICEIYEHVSITVSIDAAREDTYNYIRRSNRCDMWNVLQKNLKVISELRASKIIDFFQINMCTQMKNYKEIPEFISMGECLGVDCVYITPIRNWGTYTKEEFLNVRIIDDNKKIKDEVIKVLAHPSLKKNIVRCVI